MKQVTCKDGRVIEVELGNPPAFMLDDSTSAYSPVSVDGIEYIAQTDYLKQLNAIADPLYLVQWGTAQSFWITNTPDGNAGLGFVAVLLTRLLSPRNVIERALEAGRLRRIQ